jgi:uncharacterized RDD family membrane protein YckC
MYCHKCGAPNDDQAASCDKCGTALHKAGLDASTTAPADPSAVEYAGFWKRLLALAVDEIIWGIAGFFLMVITIAAGALRPHSEISDAAYTVVFGIVCIVFTILQLLYWPLMECSSRQGTLGKRAIGIVVTDIDGRHISFARAVGRNLGKIVSAIIYYVGFIMIAFTKKKQGLHDITANCLVVVKR